MDSAEYGVNKGSCKPVNVMTKAKERYEKKWCLVSHNEVYHLLTTAATDNNIANLLHPILSLELAIPVMAKSNNLRLGTAADNLALPVCREMKPFWIQLH